MPRDLARDVLRTEAEAILRLIDRLDQRFDRAVDMIARGHGRVLVAGMGKSGIIARKVAATLASTGTPAYFLHPAEAVHGDLGMLADGDVVLALSNSGETAEILRLLEYVRRLELRIIAFVGRMDSTLARQADISLDCGTDREAGPLGLAPTASTTAALALGDALALAVAEARGFTAEDFARRHPGGQLGRQLLKVNDVMRSGMDLPRVRTDATLGQAIDEMSAKGLGMTTIVDPAGVLAGVLTDGDLRRLLAAGAALIAASIHSVLDDIAVHRRARHHVLTPLSIRPDQLAATALALLEQRKVTSLVVTDETGVVIGVVHIHDLWRLEMF